MSRVAHGAVDALLLLYHARTCATASSTVMWVVSSSMASEHLRRGAAERWLSRASRSRISCKRALILALIPFSINWL